MEIPESIRPPRVVRVIPPTINTQESIREKYKQLRVVAYCRVSTKQEEQLNSYETQKNYGRVSSENKLRLFEYGGPQ